MANSTWQVTNATSQKNLVVINASVDSDQPQAFYYDRKITLIPFTTGRPLAPGNTGYITLPDVKKDYKGFSLPFTFIIAEAGTLAPVMAVSYKGDLSDLAAVTVDDKAVKNIQQAFAFNKNITALPGSILAVTFAALDFSDDEAVQAFFMQTKDYCNVTLDAVCLVKSYYNALPYGWANGKNTIIYLFSGEYDTGEKEGTMKSTGTVTITNDWTQPLTLTGQDQFKIEYTKNGETAKTLVFNNGVFADAADPEKATVLLAGSFFVPSQVMADNNDNGICTFLVGKIDNNSAFGYEGAAPDGTDQDGSVWKRLEAHNYRDAVRLGVYGIGILAAIGLAVVAWRFAKWCKQQGDPLVDAEKRAAEQEQFELSAATLSQDSYRRISEAINIPGRNQVGVVQSDYAAAELLVKQDQSLFKVRQMVAAQERLVEMLASKTSGALLQGMVDNMQTVETRLELLDEGVTSFIEFCAQLPDTVRLLSNNASAISVARAKIGKKLSDGEVQKYEKDMSAFNDLYKEQKLLEEEINEVRERLDARDIIDEEPIER